MSLAGRPSERNGDSQSGVPPDLVWDEDNPPIIFACTQHTEHHPKCDRTCESNICTESQVKLINEGRAFARAGMSFHGIPTVYEKVIPIPGIRIDLLDLLMQLEVLKKILLDVEIISSIEDLDEMFREFKYNFLHDIRTANERKVRERRTKEMLGIKDKPLLGPDGKPL